MGNSSALYIVCTHIHARARCILCESFEDSVFFLIQASIVLCRYKKMGQSHLYKNSAVKVKFGRCVSPK